MLLQLSAAGTPAATGTSLQPIALTTTELCVSAGQVVTVLAKMYARPLPTFVVSPFIADASAVTAHFALATAMPLFTKVASRALCAACEKAWETTVNLETSALLALLHPCLIHSLTC